MANELSSKTLTELEGLLEASRESPGSYQLGGGEADCAYLEKLVDCAPDLLAMAKRLVELEGCIIFMNQKGHWQNTTPDGIVQRAKDFGWTPDAGRGGR